MKKTIFLTALLSGIFTLTFYTVTNYVIFGDIGFVPAGRIVFASIYGYFDYLLLPISILVGMSFIRYGHSDLSDFWSLFRFGNKTTLLAAGIFSSFIFISLESDLNYFSKLIQLINRIEIPASGPTPFQKYMLDRAGAIEQTPLLRNSVFYSVANFIVYIILGLIGSYASATFLSKKTTDTDLKPQTTANKGF